MHSRTASAQRSLHSEKIPHDPTCPRQPDTNPEVEPEPTPSHTPDPEIEPDESMDK